MSLILPDARLEQPALFYPGRKPVGRVKIDWSHRMANGLISCVLFGGEHPCDLVTGERLEFSSAGRPENLGRSHKFDNNYMSKPKAFNLGGDVTMIACLTRDVELEVPFIIDDKHAGGWGANKGVLLFMRDMKLGFAVGDSSFEGGVTAFNPSVPFVFSGVSRQGQPHRLFLDGDFIISGGPNATPYNKNPLSARYGSAYAIGTYKELTGEMFYAYVFNRAFSDKEIKDINTNPYQFLIPA